jgi:hypothetical protein
MTDLSVIDDLQKRRDEAWRVYVALNNELREAKERASAEYRALLANAPPAVEE